ncbi:MAG TPA: TetR/AcrR family transcriptional regulator [Drouetiella sp.]
MKKSTKAPEAPIAKARREIKKFWNEEDDADLSETSRRKRKQILEAALESFLELGYEGASMNLVADRAGVIKQTIYSHFQDKQTLFQAVIASLTTEYVQTAIENPDVAGKPLPVVLRKLAETIFSRHEDPRHTKFVRTMIGEAGRFPELAKMFTETTVRPTSALITELLTSDTDYKFNDPEAFAKVFLGSVINHCMQQHILLGKELQPFDAMRIVDELVALVEMHKVK